MPDVPTEARAGGPALTREQALAFARRYCANFTREQERELNLMFDQAERAALAAVPSVPAGARRPTDRMVEAACKASAHVCGIRQLTLSPKQVRRMLRAALSSEATP